MTDPVAPAYSLRSLRGDSEMPRIAELRARAWAGNAAWADSRPEAWVDRFDTHGLHWLIESDGVLAGAIRLTVHDRLEEAPDAEAYQPLVSIPFSGPVACYARLVVDPAHRGQGLAARLDRACIEAAREMGACALIGATGSVAGSLHRVGTMEALGFVNYGLGARLAAAPYEAGLPTILVLWLTPSGRPAGAP